jgi:hypothetical protein
MHQDTVPCLVTLAEEFDELGPERDTASDGSVGDLDHQERSSNHNRDDVSGSSTPQSDSDDSPDIRAIDTDDSGPFINGFTMQKGVDLIVQRCRSGVENRLVEIIYNGYAWYASNGWKKVKYTGSNQHTEHAHFGAKADTGKLENDTRPWGLVEKWGDDVDKQGVKDAVLEVLQSTEGIKAVGLGMDNGMEAQKAGNDPESYATKIKHTDTNVKTVDEKVNDLTTKVDQILEWLQAPLPPA